MTSNDTFTDGDDRTAAGAGPRHGQEPPIEYGLLLDCVHCGLCTSACPTYVELGDENDSPRGRIYLMRAVMDERIGLTPKVRQHLEGCLDCRACETACPSGVQYGRLIEPFRASKLWQQAADGQTPDWFHRIILFGLFPNRTRLRTSIALARWAQRLRLDRLAHQLGLFALLPTRLRQLATMLPKLPPPLPELPERLPPFGEHRATVGLFRGCVGDAVFQQTQWHTARVLQQNGCEVIIPPSQVCCGAIHFHAGEAAPARELADRNMAAFQLEDVDAVIVNVAGCGSMLKEYGHHWHDENQSARREFAAKVRDVNEFLDSLGLVPPEIPVRTRATYHDACHLAKLIELPETELCCGAAGTYNLTQPEMSQRLAKRKLDNILSTGVQTVVTANAGCILQIARQARLRSIPLTVTHPMDVLYAAYFGDTSPTSLDKASMENTAVDSRSTERASTERAST